MSYMVIGGTGFVGSHITRRLVHEGVDVVTFSPSGNPSRFQDVANKVKAVKGSTTDIAVIIDAMKTFRVTHVVYAATEPMPWVPSNIIRTNIMGFTNVLEAARLVDVHRMVWTSSYAQLGPPELYPVQPVNEDAPVKPTMMHGPAYVCNEFMANYYAEQHGLDVLTLRIGINFGPERGGHLGAFDYVVDLFEGPALGRPARVPDGDMAVTLQYAKETANVIWTGLNIKGLKHRVFHTCDEFLTLRQVAGYVKEVVPDARLEVRPGGKTPRVRVVASRIREEWGYTPKYTVKAGAADYIRDLRAGARP